jgi:dTDP-4-dehydrorhamnose reductase
MADAYPAALFATRDELDVTDYWRLLSELERLEPTIILNAASFTHVDGCEDDPVRADLANHAGAANVARAARQIGARLLHISTDLVFDGALSRPYREDDATQPISVYGRSKLDGETAIRRELPGATILRASWFFGEGAGKFPENFLGMVERRKPLGLVADRTGSPTFIPDLAEAVVRLIPVDRPGVLHFTNLGGATTRFHFVRRAAERLGLDLSTLKPLSHLEWKGDRAPRPMNSALDPSEFIKVTGWRPRTWEEAQDAFLRSRGPAAARSTASGRPA